MQRPVQPGISDFNFTFAQKHTPVTLLCQAHIAMAAGGWARNRGKGGALLDRPPHHALKLHQNRAKRGGGVQS